MSLRLNGKVIAGSSSDTPTFKSLTVTGGEIHRGNETHDGVVAMKTLKINGKDAATSDDISAINQALTNYPTNTQTDQKINNALETLSEIKVTSKSSANDCIPTKNEKHEVFKGVFTDTPFREGTQIIESSIMLTSNEKNVYQKVTRYGSAPEYKPISYGRYGYANISSSSDYIWSPWQKITTETDLNNALTNYPTKTDLQTVTSREDKTNGALNFRKSGNIVQLRTVITMNLTAGRWNDLTTILDANLRPKATIDSIAVDNTYDLPLQIRYNGSGIIQVYPVNTIRQYNNTEVNVIGDITYLV